MPSPAQIEASRRNGKLSHGPATPGGKDKTGRNAITFGLFSAKNCVRPHESDDYNTLASALWERLEPADPLEQLYATEIIRAAWRLNRCAAVEATLASYSASNVEKGESADAPEVSPEDPMCFSACVGLQASVDRARLQAQSSLARATAELRRLQTERRLRVQVVGETTKDLELGIGEITPLLNAMAKTARRDQNQARVETERMLAQALDHSYKPQELPNTKQTRPELQSAPQPGAETAQIPRGAPCTCGSGLKFKRCCGRNAPPVLYTAA